MTLQEQVTPRSTRTNRWLTALLVAALAACSPTPPASTAPDRIDHLEGRVIEQVDAPPYSFLRVKTGDQSVWTAVPVGSYGTGATVALKNCVAVRNHVIRSQDRRLDVVYFGSLEAVR
jgi:hypothetical protein